MTPSGGAGVRLLSGAAHTIARAASRRYDAAGADRRTLTAGSDVATSIASGMGCFPAHRGTAVVAFHRIHDRSLLALGRNAQPKQCPARSEGTHRRGTATSRNIEVSRFRARRDERAAKLLFGRNSRAATEGTAKPPACNRCRQSRPRKPRAWGGSVRRTINVGRRLAEAEGQAGLPRILTSH